MQSRILHFLYPRFEPHAEVIMRRIVDEKPFDLRAKVRRSGEILSIVIMVAYNIWVLKDIIERPQSLVPLIMLGFGWLILLIMLLFPLGIAANGAVLAATQSQTSVMPLLALTNIDGRAVGSGKDLDSFGIDLDSGAVWGSMPGSRPGTGEGSPEQRKGCPINSRFQCHPSQPRDLFHWASCSAVLSPGAYALPLLQPAPDRDHDESGW
jgi:hypothetical protein